MATWSIVNLQKFRFIRQLGIDVSPNQIRINGVGRSPDRSRGFPLSLTAPSKPATTVTQLEFGRVGQIVIENIQTPISIALSGFFSG